MATSAPAKQPAKQEQSTVLREIIEKSSSQFAMLMPKETVDKFKRVVFTTLNDRPDLLRCNPRSLLSVMMHAAQDGLMLDGREAAIVPFKSGPDVIATYQPMVVGLRKKIRASGLINDINCQVVFEGDQFDIAFGDRPYVHHKPSLTGGSKRRIVGAYSVATFKDDESKSIEWMTIDQIEEIRLKSPAVRAKRPTPWDDDVFYPEMVRKTVVRRHAKSLPMASDIENVFRHEAESMDAIGHPEPYEQRTQPQIEHGPASVASTLDDFGAGFSSTATQATDSTARHEDVVGDVANGGVREAGGPSGARNPGAADIKPATSETLPPKEQVDQARELGEKAREIADNMQGREAEIEAWGHGQTDKIRGLQRKAIPGEYREDKKLWQAWLDGYDGMPLK